MPQSRHVVIIVVIIVVVIIIVVVVVSTTDRTNTVHRMLRRGQRGQVKGMGMI